MSKSGSVYLLGQTDQSMLQHLNVKKSKLLENDERNNNVSVLIFNLYVRAFVLPFKEVGL